VIGARQVIFHQALVVKDWLVLQNKSVIAELFIIPLYRQQNPFYIMFVQNKALAFLPSERKENHDINVADPKVPKRNESLQSNL
jgi:hypothetical protein